MKADLEIKSIVKGFNDYLGGSGDAPTVAGERIQDRLDLKHIVPLQGRFVKRWRRKGIEVKALGDVAQPVAEVLSPRTTPSREYPILYVTYDGRCAVQKRQLGRFIRPKEMLRVHSGDLVFSNIRATDGAIGIVPPELDGALVSHSFTVLRCDCVEDTIY